MSHHVLFHSPTAQESFEPSAFARMMRTGSSDPFFRALRFYPGVKVTGCLSLCRTRLVVCCFFFFFSRLIAGAHSWLALFTNGSGDPAGAYVGLTLQFVYTGCPAKSSIYLYVMKRLFIQNHKNMLTVMLTFTQRNLLWDNISKPKQINCAIWSITQMSYTLCLLLLSHETIFPGWANFCTSSIEKNSSWCQNKVA